MTEKVKIENMTIKDLDDIMKIERQIFSSQWPRKIFHAELSDNPYAHYYTLRYEGKLVGYAGLWIIKEGAQVTNIAIAPNFQGKSLGKKLFSFIFQKAIKAGCDNLSLEVRKSNTIAQQMYKQFGLVPTGVRREYYTDNREDAIVMWVNFK